MLLARIITSLVLIAGLLAGLFYLPDHYWALLTLLIIGLALAEWGGFMRLSRPWQLGYAIVSMLIFGGFILTELPGLEQLQSYLVFYGILAAVFFWLLVVPFWLITRAQIRNKLVLGLVGWIVLIPTWLAFTLLKSASFLALVSLQQAAIWLLLVVMVTVWIADSAAYFFGKRFGKHKLAPQISPGKTWEGVLGAWIVVGLYGVALCYFLDASRWLIVALWGITLLSIMGDLFESLMKRHSDIKDSGALLPGHGGVLDRIDGLTSSLPLVTFFVYFPLYYQAWILLVPSQS